MILVWQFKGQRPTTVTGFTNTTTGEHRPLTHDDAGRLLTSQFFDFDKKQEWTIRPTVQEESAS